MPYSSVTPVLLGGGAVQLGAISIFQNSAELNSATIKCNKSNCKYSTIENYEIHSSDEISNWSKIELVGPI